MVTITAKRLLFKKAVIEKLESDQPFQVVTPLATFQFTRKQFETTFASILITRSWLDFGVYHWPVIPKKALPFKVE